MSLECQCPCVKFVVLQVTPGILTTGARGDGGTMAVMHVPHDQPADWPDVPHEHAFRSLREFRDRIGQDKRRMEIIEGRLIVSPVPVIWHERVCNWLNDQIRAVCHEKGWFVDRAGEIELPPTKDLIEPDLMVLRDPDTLPDLEPTRPLDHVLLVAEVISRSSIREDREVKPLACGLAGVPLYLLVDRFASPMSISLFSEPGAEGYVELKTVNVGGKLRLPEPFDVTLDTASLPSPRRGDPPSE
jgi:Uma2 family endonuclease